MVEMRSGFPILVSATQRGSSPEEVQPGCMGLMAEGQTSGLFHDLRFLRGLLTQVLSLSLPLYLTMKVVASLFNIAKRKWGKRGEGHM